MFIPGELPSSCQIRGGYIKGAMFPFDFRLFAHEISHNSILVDPWGTPHDVEKGRCKIHHYNKSVKNVEAVQFLGRIQEKISKKII